MNDGCLDPDVIDGMVAGRLAGPALERAEAHLDSCRDCRELVSELARHRTAATAETVADRAARTPAVSPLPTGQIDRYRIIRRIGSGGMGVVLLAEDPELKRNVVIKLLRAEIVEAGTQDRERLLREAQAMAKVSHSNVVPIYDVGVHDERVFLAMEYIDGWDLAAWLREAPRLPIAVLDVFLAAGRGLAAAHRAGLVHRDFKPHNVMIGRTGEVKVTDFGLARTGSSRAHAADPRGAANLLDSPITRTGMMVGTPAYMAPEQIMGDPVDARSDQFSFCVALFEALHGTRPFHGRTAEEQFEATLRGVVPEVARPPGITARAERAIRRGLAVVPADRFATMEALLGELAPRRARRTGLIAAGIAAAAIGAAGGALLIVDRTPAPAPAPPARSDITKVVAAWQTARACLVGAHPAVRDLAIAVAAQDLVRAPRETCDAPLAALRTSIAPDSDEAGARQAAQDVTAAYAVHKANLVAKQPGTDELHVAIASLDSVLGRFRTPPPPVAETLETIEPEPIEDLEEGEPVTFVSADASELVVQLPTGKRAAIAWRYTFPMLGPAGRSYSPARAWHADAIVRSGSTQLVAGGTTLARGPAATTAIAAVLGDGAERIIVYRSGDWFVARSTDRGRRWTSERLLAADVEPAIAVALLGARVDIAWFAGETRWLALATANAGGPLPAPRAIAAAKPVSTCARGALWLAVPDGKDVVVRRVDGAPVGRFRGDVHLLACAADRVVVEVDQEQQLCTTTCSKLPPAPRAIAATWGAEVIGGRLLRFAMHPNGHLLALWRDREPPQFFGWGDDVLAGVLDNGSGEAIAFTRDRDGGVSTTPLPH